jgi:hypothetical protein
MSSRQKSKKLDLGDRLEITNLDGPKSNKDDRNSDPRMPQHPARICVIGESGSGKTNLLINMLSKGWMDYDKIILCLKNPDQPSYEHFINKCRDVAEEYDIDPDEYITVVSDVNNIPTIESLPGGNVQTIIVFDDFVTESKAANDRIASYWSRSRHKNVTCFYLSQSFYATPIFIRQNSTYFILFFGLVKSNLAHLYKDISPGIDKDEFIHLYNLAADKRHEFLFIDKLNDNPKLRFRKGFDGIFTE